MAMAAIPNPFLLLPQPFPQFPCKPTTRLRTSTIGSTTSLLRASPKPPPKREARREAEKTEVEDLAHVLMRKAGDEKTLLASLNKYVKVIRTEHCFRLFEELGKRDKWLHCLEVFRWMQRQKWYVADNGIYSKLISVMGRKGQTRMAMWLFTEMRRSGCRPDTSVYNALITAHLHSSDKVKGLAKASGFFEKMKGIERCKPNIVTYNILLRAYAAAKDLQRVESLFKDLEENSMSPDIYTYNGVMDAYGKNGMIGEMESLLVQMRSHDCKPDGITFNILIDSYGKKQMFDKMEQTFRVLLRSKANPTPSTFNSMILNYGKARQREKVESIFSKMKDLGLKPGQITYESLITSYGYCDCISKARAIVDEMMASDGEMHASLLNAMLDAYCKNGLPGEADAFLDLATRKGFQPSVSTYKILYKAYSKGREEELLNKLRSHMTREGFRADKYFFTDVLQDTCPPRPKQEGQGSKNSLGTSTSSPPRPKQEEQRSKSSLGTSTPRRASKSSSGTLTSRRASKNGSGTSTTNMDNQIQSDHAAKGSMACLPPPPIWKRSREVGD